MSTKNPSKQKRKQSYNQGQQNRQGQQSRQPQQQAQPTRPRPTPADTQALAAQEAARKEARLQRQAQARAEAEKRKRQANVRRYGIIALVTVAVVALVAWLFIREAGKPGQAVEIMGDRAHIATADTPHTPYSTSPPTSGPHVNEVPGFQVYTEPIAKELQVHGLEDGAVVINYQPGLDKATVDKLAELARLYQATPGKGRVILSPYPDLSNPIVLTTWGRIDRLDTLDEARIRLFVDAYVNIDHHETTEGQRLP